MIIKYSVKLTAPLDPCIFQLKDRECGALYFPASSSHQNSRSTPFLNGVSMLRQAEDFKARRPQVLPGARHAMNLKVSPNSSDHKPCITSFDLSLY